MRTSDNILYKARHLFVPSRERDHVREKIKVDIVIVIPIGPKCKVQFVLDTIASVMHYIPAIKAIIIADDSQKPENGKRIRQFYPDAVVIASKSNLGKGTGLYTNLCIAYSYSLDHYEFPALLRLDSDALVIGFGIEKDIADHFAAHPKVGITGTYIRGTYSRDEFGNGWDSYGSRGLVIAIAKMINRYFLQNPIAFWKIRKRLFKALDLGYEFGDFVFGGSYAFSRAGLEALRAQGLLPIRNILGAGFEEDHLFSLLMRSVNMELSDMSRNAGPFGLVWKGLPATPEQLCKAGKKIIHSTRYYKDLREGEIRAFFQKKRLEEASEMNVAENEPIGQ